VANGRSIEVDEFALQDVLDLKIKELEPLKGLD